MRKMKDAMHDEHQSIFIINFLFEIFMNLLLEMIKVLYFCQVDVRKNISLIWVFTCLQKQ